MRLRRPVDLAVLGLLRDVDRPCRMPTRLVLALEIAQENYSGFQAALVHLQAKAFDLVFLALNVLMLILVDPLISIRL